MNSLGQELWAILAINFGIVMVAVLILWLVSIAIRDVSIIDMFFAVIFFFVAGATYLLSDGVAVRKQLILVLVSIWALRITLHLLKRNWGHGEDPRYAKLRTWVDSERAFIWMSLRKVFLLQGLIIWFASLPVQVGQILQQPASPGWPAYLGIAIWLLGFLYETISDLQLTRFRADPANAGTVLQTGLWRHSRHPNYFGELCVWWGLFIIACDHPIGILTIIGPILYTYLIVNVTGKATLDKKLAKERPGYRDYMDNTSAIIPLPRKKVRS